jgi:hypothetical protein
MAAHPDHSHGHSHSHSHSHGHDPNPTPPAGDATLCVVAPNGREVWLAVEDLARLPQARAEGCYIVSTGHGTSGPFAFGGPTLADVIAAAWPGGWQQARVVSGDGYAANLAAAELPTPPAQPILLALTRDDRPLSRAQGLVRLIIPQGDADALRQVKWVARILLDPT